MLLELGTDQAEANIKLLTPGLDNTRLFMSLTAGAGTRCMSLLFHLQAYRTHASPSFMSSGQPKITAPVEPVARQFETFLGDSYKRLASLTCRWTLPSLLLSCSNGIRKGINRQEQERDEKSKDNSSQMPGFY